MFSMKIAKFAVPAAVIIIILAGLITYWQLNKEPTEPPTETGIVSEAIDDLTFRLESGHRIRYVGLEAPEEGKCFSGKILEGNVNLIGQEVRLEIEPMLEKSVDGAWTRYVWVMEEPKPTPEVTDETASSTPAQEPKEILINNRIIEMGLAFPLLSPDMKYHSMMSSSTRYASATYRGLWGECEVYNDEATGRLKVK